jgi:hypothetical protein
MIRAVVRSLFVVCLLVGIGVAETPAASAAPTSHVAKKHAHKKLKRKARKSKRRHRHHHKVKKHAPVK